MLYISLALVGALAVTVSVSARIIQSLIRSHARERDLLLNQLLHATGKPWQPAPADQREAPEPKEPRRFVAAPEQHPVFD